MFAALIQLLTEALRCALDSMGTNVLVIGLGFLVFVSMELYSINQHGWWHGLEGMRGRLRGSGIALLVTVIGWTCVFGYCVMKLIYDKHQALKLANSEQVKMIQGKDKIINDQKTNIQNLESKLKQQPKVVYRDKEVAKIQEEPRKCWLNVGRVNPNKGFDYAREIIVFCNKRTESPAKVAIEFDNEFVEGTLTVLGAGGVMTMGHPNKPSRIFIDAVIAPPVREYQPIVVTVQVNGAKPRNVVRADFDTMK